MCEICCTFARNFENNNHTYYEYYETHNDLGSSLPADG